MDKIRGGLFGLLIGDALGVPYEFYAPDALPPLEELEFTPPAYFKKTYEHVLAGTWSDDGAQALCLLESLLDCGKFDLHDFAEKLIDWYENGRWAVDQIVFDVGIQTGEALIACKRGLPPEQSGNCRPDGKGNGALMRVLPLALWHSGSEESLVRDAHAQCLVTHGHICNQVCCALYCLVARALLGGSLLKEAYQYACQTLRRIYCGLPQYAQELEWSVRPEEAFSGSGSGYVVDCLKSALMVLSSADSYECAVKKAVALGNDTDTTACVTGGLAGILYGLENIPLRWRKALRGQEDAKQLAERLCRSSQ